METDCWDVEVDPRIKGELEKLNNTNHRINLLEKDYEDAQETFRITMAKSASHLTSLNDKLGKKVDQARPYYEAKTQTEQVHNESEQAAARYDRACDNYNAAKDMVKKAEEKLKQDKRFLDSACQEMLNHATIKVMKANKEKAAAEKIHLEVSQAFTELQLKKTCLEKCLKSVINKTRSYFELKEKYNQTLEAHKQKVVELQQHITMAKIEYQDTLRNLEKISDSIHERRNSEANLLEPRGEGVGAENPDEACRSEHIAKINERCNALFDSHKSVDYHNLDEVATELENAIKSLTLQNEQERDSIPDGDCGEDMSEIMLSIENSDNSTCNNTPHSLVSTCSTQLDDSNAMDTKLFITPPPTDTCEDEVGNKAVRLEKWFFFSPSSKTKTEFGSESNPGID
ncbi:SH3 domain-binding protein 5-like [Xenia sp. Carnegie-2017]|uniref:SH3 domain-binding protein 5-like n=1 Tax=Xenia sp. Carnegie-2017 TaxID=2897299 RepID=UPI001F043F1A|nr:SH3 domain-binding protein 5-like [Xenia sp. Carnegie-2017]